MYSALLVKKHIKKLEILAFVHDSFHQAPRLSVILMDVMNKRLIKLDLKSFDLTELNRKSHFHPGLHRLSHWSVIRHIELDSCKIKSI